MNKYKLTIIVDMDDVLEDLLSAWVARLNDVHKLRKAVNDISEWDMRKAYPTLTLDQILEPLYDDSFWITVKPKVDAMKFIPKLVHEGFRVVVCTDSNYVTLEIKMQTLLYKYFPDISRDNIVITKDKSLIIGDIIIDDYPENLRNSSAMKILYDAPYNKLCDEDIYDFRAYNWADVYKLVHEWYNIRITKNMLIKEQERNKS